MPAEHETFSGSREAVRDAILLRAGVAGPAALLHPGAAALADAGDSNLLKTLAILSGSTAAARNRTGWQGAVGFGINSNDFSNALADLLKSASIAGLVAHDGHRDIADLRTLPNFMSHRFSSADIDVSLADETRELAAFSHVFALEDSAGVAANIKTYGRNLGVSRGLILSDDIGLLASVGKRAGAAASHREASAVYGLLEANPTLGDGEAMFHIDHGNVQADALSDTALGSAMGKLRKATTPTGAIANLDAAFLAVEPDLELAARKLVRDAALPIKVIASAWLAPGRWYLMASPDAAPVIALLHLATSSKGVTVGRMQKDSAATYDGVVMAIRFDFGVVPVGRMGAVRGGA